MLLIGHERPLTMVKFNREGDIFFSASRDKQPTVWSSTTGERLGTYDGHNGVVWCLDTDWNSTRLVTASGDSSCKLWDVQTGRCLYTWAQQAPVRSVAFAPGDRVVSMSIAAVMNQSPDVFLYRLSDDLQEQGKSPFLKLSGHTQNVVRILWSPIGDTVLTASEDGTVRRWDAETGAQLDCVQLHTLKISDMQFDSHALQFITASKDQTAKLVDTKSLQVLKTYKTDAPVNSASISPILPHVLLGGGQEAADVTTTSNRAGKFEGRFFHKIYETEFGRVRGHFGPINTLAFSPDGKQYVSGGEEGFVRLHTFDSDYFTKNYN